MIGKTVGHYRITAKLGAGGMGEVFLAQDARLERKAAIKFLPEEVAADRERRQRFLREARAASALNHPHVCVVYDVGETDDGLPFIAMEFIEGGSLESVLKNRRFEITQIVDLAAQVADALDAAHACRIVHRDIKPANISVNERGQVKVLDFGLAKRLATDSLDSAGMTTEMQQTQDGALMGTPRYMSPEQALGKPADHRSDLFSLGVVLYELTTGQLPFAGANLGEILNNVVHSQPTAIARLNYDVPPELRANHTQVSAEIARPPLPDSSRADGRSAEPGQGPRTRPIARRAGGVRPVGTAQDNRGKRRRDRGRAVLARAAQDQRRSAQLRRDR